MLTQQEKDFLLQLLASAQIGGNRATIVKTLMLMDSIETKIKEMPVEEKPKK